MRAAPAAPRGSSAYSVRREAEHLASTARSGPLAPAVDPSAAASGLDRAAVDPGGASVDPGGRRAASVNSGAAFGNLGPRDPVARPAAPSGARRGRVSTATIRGAGGHRDGFDKLLADPLREIIDREDGDRAASKDDERAPAPLRTT